jgi:hypothetical protein
MDYAPDGRLKRWSNSAISCAAEFPGNADQFVTALLDSHWLDKDMRLHDWFDYGGKLVKQKTLNKEKQRRHRAKISGLRHHDITVTSPGSHRDKGLRNPLEERREEKRRVEKNKGGKVTPQGTVVELPGASPETPPPSDSPDNAWHGKQANGHSMAEWPSFDEWKAAAEIEGLSPTQIQTEWAYQESKIPNKRWHNVDRTRLRQHAVIVRNRFAAPGPGPKAGKAFAHEIASNVKLKKIN